MTDFAPAPWSYEASGKPGANGDFNIYLVDKDGRKIAAVWGKRGEKEATAATMMAAPELLSACKAALGAFENNNAIDWSELEKAIALAEGRK